MERACLNIHRTPFFRLTHFIGLWLSWLLFVQKSTYLKLRWDAISECKHNIHIAYSISWAERPNSWAVTASDGSWSHAWGVSSVAPKDSPGPRCCCRLEWEALIQWDTCLWSPSQSCSHEGVGATAHRVGERQGAKEKTRAREWRSPLNALYGNIHSYSFMWENHYSCSMNEVCTRWLHWYSDLLFLEQ